MKSLQKIDTQRVAEHIRINMIIYTFLKLLVKKDSHIWTELKVQQIKVFGYNEHVIHIKKTNVVLKGLCAKIKQQNI